MVTREILEILVTLGSASTSIIFADYYHSVYRNIRRKIMHNSTWDPNVSSYDIKRTELQKFSNMLSYLKKKGLVEKKNSGDWKITGRGKERLERMKKKDITRPFNTKGEIKKGDFKVIVFDVPESDKCKRDWLRASLKNLGFEMLQKSVWTGDNKLPEEFMLSVKEFGLLPYLHIFLVREGGTINFNG